MAFRLDLRGHDPRFEVRHLAGGRSRDDGAAEPGARLAFSATAYCKGDDDHLGRRCPCRRRGRRPEVLPVGSVVDIEARSAAYSGIYTVLDTGPSVQGRLVDLYMWSCNEALAFGRQTSG